LGTGAAGVPQTDAADDVACAEASRAMFEAWSEECILRFPDGDFKAQELANAVWAVATAGFAASDEFWDSAARAAVPLMRDPEQAQTQNIANCLWSYAKSGDGTPAVRKELFSELADASSKRVDEFNAQELGNTVRSSFVGYVLRFTRRPGRTPQRRKLLQNSSTPSRRAPRAASSASSPKIWPILLGPSRRRRTGRRVCWMPSRGRRRAGRRSSSPRNWYVLH